MLMLFYTVTVLYFTHCVFSALQAPSPAVRYSIRTRMSWAYAVASLYSSHYFAFEYAITPVNIFKYHYNEKHEITSYMKLIY